jgi:hypothetical protein
MAVNWLAAPGQQWTVPVGGGFGRVFRVGDQPISASIEAYYNAVRPTGASDWQLRTFVALLFPVKCKVAHGRSDPMSAIGTKRTSQVAPHMSAIGGKADMAIALRNVR